MGPAHDTMSHQQPQTFTLTEQHIKLVRAMCVEWSDEAYDGAPAVNIKRPYGNSFVPGDVAKILGLDLGRDEETGRYDDATTDSLMAIHQQTAIALQIIISTGCFEPGEYFRPERYNTQKWVKATMA